MTMRWDAARAASNRPTRKYKPVGPVGVAVHPEFVGRDNACRGCGYLLCNCALVAPPYGKTASGVELQYNAYPKRGCAYSGGNGVIYCGLLTEKQLENIKHNADLVLP